LAVKHFRKMSGNWWEGVVMAETPTRPAPRMVSVLTENWTMTDPRDIRDIVRMAQEAEDAGFDMVMVSDHVLLGPSAGSAGRMANPRDYAMPGNQDPATAWPSNIVLLSAIAAATTRIRIGAIALIAPLRHPLVLAHDLATLDLLSEGRLVIQPTVSWHRDEYDALGVPFDRRGSILDEQLEIWREVWSRSPVSHHGEFFDFEDVYLEPKPWRPEGPAMWFGGERVHSAIVDRLVRYGSGYHPLGRVTEADVETLRAALAEAGRSVDELELVGGTRVEFPSDHEPAPLGPALEEVPRQAALGFTTFVVKPSIFIDDRSRHAAFCREVIDRVTALTS
jgi:probable F420-dependent oxidoreductase